MIITINENETLKQNISINYASISLNGYTLENLTEDSISNITINFTPDVTVENNTAQDNTIQSDINGFYEIDIQPGSYTVNVNQSIIENNVSYRFTYQGKLEIEIGEGFKTLDIVITKLEEE